MHHLLAQEGARAILPAGTTASQLHPQSRPAILVDSHPLLSQRLEAECSRLCAPPHGLTCLLPATPLPPPAALHTQGCHRRGVAGRGLQEEGGQASQEPLGPAHQDAFLVHAPPGVEQVDGQAPGWQLRPVGVAGVWPPPPPQPGLSDCWWRACNTCAWVNTSTPERQPCTHSHRWWRLGPPAVHLAPPCLALLHVPALLAGRWVAGRTVRHTGSSNVQQPSCPCAGFG